VAGEEPSLPEAVFGPAASKAARDRRTASGRVGHAWGRGHQQPGCGEWESHCATDPFGAGTEIPLPPRPVTRQ